MIDKEFIMEKVNLISQDLERLEEFSHMEISEVAKDYIRYAALKNIFMETIGRAIDINEHLISQCFGSSKEVPKTYKGTFLLLEELKILPADFAREIAKSAGFRNAIVHEYNNLDKGIVYKTVGQAVDQYKKYCEYVLNFLDKSK